jgi:hypothetical protein
VARGGGYGYTESYCYVTHRGHFWPYNTDGAQGFRLASQ